MQLNNVLMSDFQKIIFVNNIDENSNVITDSKYNFAVFFTKNSTPIGWPTGEWGSNMINIWHKGQRLNRFIGIDNENNEIAFGGGHKIKLMFNYNNGLLSIIDANKLDDIQFVCITYTSISGEIVSISSPSDSNYGNNYHINAKDNKFNLYIKFKGYTDKNAIGSLVIDTTDNAIQQDGTVTQCTDENIIQYFCHDENEIIYIFPFKIVKDTVASYNSTIDYTYSVASSYDVTKRINIPLICRINPLTFTVQSRGKTINTNDNDELLPETNYSYTINLSPNSEQTPYSYNDHQIDFSIISENANYVTIEGGSTQNNVSTKNIKITEANRLNPIEFTLNTKQIQTNSIENISISIILKLNNSQYQLNSANPFNFNVQLSGSTTNKLYYIGFKNPDNPEEFTFNDLILYDELNKGTLLYSWEPAEINYINNQPTVNNAHTNVVTGIPSNEISNDYSNKFMYIVLPNNEDIHIKYNLYTIDNTYIGSDGKKYANIKIGDYRQSDYSVDLIKNNLSVTSNNGKTMLFKLYKCAYKGLFRGKVQIDNN